MKLYSVGPDELGEWDLKEFPEAEYLVYYYESGSYDGSGTALAKTDGKFYSYNLGHCSCYGPLESDGELYDLNSENVEYTKINEEVLQKVQELENQG